MNSNRNEKENYFAPPPFPLLYPSGIGKLLSITVHPSVQTVLLANAHCVTGEVQGLWPWSTINTGPPVTFLSDVLLLPGVTEILQLWFRSIPSYTPAVQRGRYWGMPWMCAWVAAELVSPGHKDSSSRVKGRASSLGQGEVGQAFPRVCESSSIRGGGSFPLQVDHRFKAEGLTII